MKTNRMVKIAAACLAGLIVSAGYMLRIQQVRDQIQELDQAVDVLAARRPLEAGEVATAEILSTKKVPVGHLSRRAMSADDLPLILGQAFVHPVPEGDLILWSDLSDGPRLRYPTERIPEGYRCFALPADEIHTLTHLLSPGDRVDVLWTHFPSGASNPSSQVIAEALPVMAVGKFLENNNPSQSPDEVPASVTLLVTESQARTLSCAAISGEIFLLGRTRGNARPASISPPGSAKKPDGGATR